MWVSVVRSGNNFPGYYSLDDVTITNFAVTTSNTIGGVQTQVKVGGPLAIPQAQIAGSDSALLSSDKMKTASVASEILG